MPRPRRCGAGVWWLEHEFCDCPNSWDDDPLWRTHIFQGGCLKPPTRYSKSTLFQQIHISCCNILKKHFPTFDPWHLRLQPTAGKSGHVQVQPILLPRHLEYGSRNWVSSQKIVSKTEKISGCFFEDVIIYVTSSSTMWEYTGKTRKFEQIITSLAELTKSDGGSQEWLASLILTVCPWWNREDVIKLDGPSLHWFSWVLRTDAGGE